MPNKAVHQLPIATTRLPGDKIPISRETSPGVFKDFQADESLYPAVEPLSATITIPSADILNLFSVRQLIVETPGDGSVIMPIRALATLTGVTTPYATNVNVTVLGENASEVNQYWGLFQIDSASDTEILFQGALSAGTRLYVDQSLYVQSQTGDPTAGDGDLTVTVWYKLLYP